MKRFVSAFLHEMSRVWARRPRGRRGAAALFLGTVGTATGFVVVTAAHVGRSAGPFLFERVEELGARDVAIVPGCRVHADGTPSPMLQDRLSTALEVWQRGKAARILVSGSGRAPDGDETGAMRRWLIDRGVPPEDVLPDGEGLRTLDTMARARRLFGVASAVVCTQRFHLARSVFLARRFGMDAVGIAADRRPYAKARIDRVRETYARSAAFLEVYALRRGADR